MKGKNMLYSTKSLTFPPALDVLLFSGCGNIPICGVAWGISDWVHTAVDKGTNEHQQH